MKVLDPTQAGPRLLTERATNDTYLHLFTPSYCDVQSTWPVCWVQYRYAPQNDVPVDGPHIRRWPHNIIIQGEHKVFP